MFVCVHMCVSTVVPWYIGGQKTTLEELVLSFYHVDPEIKLRSSYLVANIYPVELSHWL